MPTLEIAMDPAPAPPADRPLPLEHAWTLIADGLHIHRFYLHVDALLRAQGGDERVLGPLLRQGAGYTAPVGAAAATVLPVEGPLFLKDGAPAFRAAPPAASTRAAFEGAVRLLDRAGLRYLPELAVRFVLETDEALPPGPLHPALPRTVALRPSADAAEYAEALAGAAACHFLYLFFLIEAPPEANGLGPHAPLFARLAGPYRDAVRLRFLESVPDAPRAGARAAALRAEIGARIGQVYADLDRVADSRVVELLETAIPGPRRFVRFAGGGGPGQSS